MRVALAATLLAVALPAAAQTPNGEAVYRQHCAGCHNGSMPRMPNRDALKTLTPEHVETALNSFSMRRQGASRDAIRYMAEGFEDDSLMDFAHDATSHAVPKLWKIRGGNDRLPFAMADGLREKIRYGAAVQRIGAALGS